MYDGNGDRIFTLNSYDAEDYVTNGKGTAANVYSSLSSKDVYSYDRTMVKNELLIPNGITLKTAFEYELTGYINNINTEHTQVLMEFGSNGRWSNVYDYGVNRNSGDIRSNQKLYYMYDGRGSVSNLTSNSGINMVYYEYGVFGETVSSADGIPNPYQYNAEYTDAATGLQYLRARYYDSEINRFLTKDTYLGETNEPLTKNLYAYANNNPINLNDPSGHLFGLIMGIITVGVTIYSSYKAVKTHNQQSAQIRQSQSNYESNATVQTGKISGRSYAAPTSANQTGSFSYYNARDNKTVTFTSAADYFAYKKLCDELDALDKNVASQIIHNTLDAAGVVPGLGEVADALNGVVYLAEGDKKNAVNSFISCVPVVGDAIGKGAKNAGKLLGLASGSVKYLDEVTEFGQKLAKKGPEIAETIIENSDETIEAIETAIKNSDGATDAIKSTVKNSSDVVDDVADNSIKYMSPEYEGSYNFKADDLELLESGNEIVKKHDDELLKQAKTRTIEFNGKKVTQNDDLFDPNRIDDAGVTNIEKMKMGLAPTGTDGKAVNIHHIDQTNDGPVMEILESAHQQNYKELHSNTGQSKSLIERAEFGKWRRNYWKNRANELS